MLFLRHSVYALFTMFVSVLYLYTVVVTSLISSDQTGLFI